MAIGTPQRPGRAGRAGHQGGRCAGRRLLRHVKGGGAPKHLPVSDRRRPVARRVRPDGRNGLCRSPALPPSGAGGDRGMDRAVPAQAGKAPDPQPSSGRAAHPGAGRGRNLDLPVFRDENAGDAALYPQAGGGYRGQALPAGAGIGGGGILPEMRGALSRPGPRGLSEMFGKAYGVHADPGVFQGV